MGAAVGRIKIGDVGLCIGQEIEGVRLAYNGLAGEDAGVDPGGESQEVGGLKQLFLAGEVVVKATR